MKDLSLHLLDVAENSVRAGAALVTISLELDRAADLFTLVIEDDGKGIDADHKAGDPFFTSKEGKRFGLGLPLLAQSASEVDGSMEVTRRPEGGTRVRAVFRPGHIDMKPLGDMGATVATLAGAQPGVEFRVRIASDRGAYEFDTRQLKQELDGLPIETPTVLQYMRQEINDALRRLHE